MITNYRNLVFLSLSILSSIQVYAGNLCTSCTTFYRPSVPPPKLGNPSPGSTFVWKSDPLGNGRCFAVQSQAEVIQVSYSYCETVAPPKFSTRLNGNSELACYMFTPDGGTLLAGKPVDDSLCSHGPNKQSNSLVEWVSDANGFGYCTERVAGGGVPQTVDNLLCEFEKSSSYVFETTVDSEKKCFHRSPGGKLNGGNSVPDFMCEPQKTNFFAISTAIEGTHWCYEFDPNGGALHGGKPVPSEYCFES